MERLWMNARRDSTDGPENVDELFAEIVAGLERDGVGKDWLDLDEASPDAVDQDQETVVPHQAADGDRAPGHR